MGPLRHRTGFPDRELAGVAGTRDQLGTGIPFPRQPAPTAPTPTAPATTGSLYQLRITLLDIKPPVWRTVIVEGHRTLDHLHAVIQAAFGWWNYHLHEFEVGRSRYGVPDPDGDWNPSRDERRTRIDAIASEGTSFRYTYDFGDGWEHAVAVEKILAPDPAIAVPACIDGRRACPPEDCGGAWGYRELLSILADPMHPEHGQRLEWVGRRFDPEAFDVNDFADNLRNGRLATFPDHP